MKQIEWILVEMNKKNNSLISQKQQFEHNQFKEYKIENFTNSKKKVYLHNLKAQKIEISKEMQTCEMLKWWNFCNFIEK